MRRLEGFGCSMGRWYIGNYKIKIFTILKHDDDVNMMVVCSDESDFLFAKPHLDM